MSSQPGFSVGPNEEIYRYFQQNKEQIKQQLQDVLGYKRAQLWSQLLPKIILLQHRQRELWLQEYVTICCDQFYTYIF
jgi:hypothetical protein